LPVSTNLIAEKSHENQEGRSQEKEKEADIKGGSWVLGRPGQAVPCRKRNAVASLALRKGSQETEEARLPKAVDNQDQCGGPNEGD